MSKKNRQKVKVRKVVYCNPDICDSCQYIGDGDSFCDEIQQMVLEDWEPTEHFMGEGCPNGKH
jgi:hypothetical protein